MVREHSPESYVVGEQPEVYNTQFVDMWFDWGKRDNMAEVIRYVLPDSLQMWCIDEHERDVVSKAFASGHILALMTHELTGMLSDAPELAEHVARLAVLKNKTAAYLARGRFVDNRGLSCEGALAYAYTSEPGLAVALANSEPKEVTAKVEIRPAVLGKTPKESSMLYSEDGGEVTVPLVWEEDKLVLKMVLPAFAAAAWCIPSA